MTSASPSVSACVSRSSEAGKKIDLKMSLQANATICANASREKKINKVNLDNDDNVHGDDADGRDDLDEDALEDDKDDPDVI